MSCSNKDVRTPLHAQLRLCKFAHVIKDDIKNSVIIMHSNTGAMSLPEQLLVTSGHPSNSPNSPKPNVHISQLIATANQKVNPEVTAQKMTGHHQI